jgi:hypothetical protein
VISNVSASVETIRSLEAIHREIDELEKLGYALEPLNKGRQKLAELYFLSLPACKVEFS